MATLHPSAPASASVRVLTDASLLLLVVSFQRGVPSAAVPLLRRYRAEGHVTFDRAKRTFSNAQLQDCRVLDEWAQHTMGEAIVFYGDYDALRTVWRQWGSTHGTPHDRGSLHSRLCEAACAFGKLDMLQWLYHTQQDVAMEISRTSLNVYASVTNGQLHVLEWLDAQFPTHVRGLLREMNCAQALKRGHATVVRWLLEHRVGRFPPDAMKIACENGYLEILQLFLAHTMVLPPSHMSSLLATAALVGHVDIVQWLIQEKRTRYEVRLVTRALQYGHVEVAELLLTQRHAYTPSIEGALDALVVDTALRNNKLRVLEYLISVRDREKLPLSVCACTRAKHSVDALQLLLPISSSSEISRTLVELTAHGDASPSVAYLLSHAADSLPPAVVAFAGRRQRRELGALVTLICAATEDDDAARSIALIQNADFARAVAEATTDELCDSVLVASVCWEELMVLEWLLRFDLQRASSGGAPTVQASVELLEVCEQIRGGAATRVLREHIAWRKNMQR